MTLSICGIDALEPGQFSSSVSRLKNGCVTPSVDGVPNRLQQSRRTVQRRLAERHTNFREPLTDVRKHVAAEYLKTSGMDLPEMALFLGYADISAFDHAFRGWTGKTPATCRERMLTYPEIR